MPRYCYVNKATGQRVERLCPIGQAPQAFRQGAAQFVRDVGAEVKSQVVGVRNGSRFITKPSDGTFRSDALAVHPDQIPEALADAQRRDVKIAFEGDGTAVWKSRRDRKNYCEAYGYHDKDGGYGDPQPGKNKHLNYEG